MLSRKHALHHAKAPVKTKLKQMFIGQGPGQGFDWHWEAEARQKV